ncbi:hypothetical protein FCM35_KLT08611 [Carex littledalei]|uniref:Retrotransposon gag domain-containing protein n=1 Tax=Carex littledalei TaxID=544730 RepID=A0A833V6W9_9POAL|nr:hypothetical protein FCM35_KLT08611 [Carex littledalei]
MVFMVTTSKDLEEEDDHSANPTVYMVRKGKDPIVENPSDDEEESDAACLPPINAKPKTVSSSDIGHMDRPALGVFQGQHSNGISLEPGSIRSWDQMARAFINRFATASSPIRLADLAWAKQGPNETLLAYINRWRNMSNKSSHPIPEREAVDLLIRSTSGKMREMLIVANPNSYQDLVDTVSRLGQTDIEEKSSTSFKPRRDFPKKKESKTVYAVKTNKANKIENSDSDSSDEEARQVDSQPAQPITRDNQKIATPDHWKNKRQEILLQKRENSKDI